MLIFIESKVFLLGSMFYRIVTTHARYLKGAISESSDILILSLIFYMPGRGNRS